MLSLELDVEVEDEEEDDDDDDELGVLTSTGFDIGVLAEETFCLDKTSRDIDALVGGDSLGIHDCNSDLNMVSSHSGPLTEELETE